MKFIENLNSIFSKAGEYWERSLTAQYTVSIDACSFSSIDVFVEFISSLPKRDTISVKFVDDGEKSFSFSNQLAFGCSEWEIFYQGACEAEYGIKILVSIDKKISENTCTIYSYKNFIDDILKSPIIQSIVTFNHVLCERDFLIFEVFDDGIYWQTSTMTFKSLNNDFTSTEQSRLILLQQCKENSRFYNIDNYALLPFDFHIIIDYASNPLADTFKKLETLFSIIYIATSSSINCNKCCFNITSLRNIYDSIEIENIKYNKELYNIYEWSYSSGNISDKLGLARNILSLNCRYINILDIESSVLAAIKSNFQIYLKTNISQYFEAKNKVGDYIRSILINIADHANKLTINFAHNIVVILAFMLSTVMPKFVQNNTASEIFTTNTAYIAFLVLFCSIIYVIICTMNFNTQIENIKCTYYYLKENYEPLFSIDELEEIFDDKKIIEDRVEKQNTKRNTIVFLWSLVIMTIAFFVYSNSDLPEIDLPNCLKFLGLQM